MLHASSHSTKNQNTNGSVLGSAPTAINHARFPPFHATNNSARELKPESVVGTDSDYMGKEFDIRSMERMAHGSRHGSFTVVEVIRIILISTILLEHVPS